MASGYGDAFSKAREDLIPANYLEAGLQGIQQRTKLFRHFIEQRKWPVNGWSSTSVKEFFSFLSAMDSNNFESNAGVGEREGRIYSDIVKQRNFGMSHGIGRSGDITEAQPKAVGSSLMYSITNALVLDFIKQTVSPKTADAIVLPMATGMSITLCLQTMRKSNPDAKFVIWSRIDQKSCFKAITAAGLTPIVIDTISKDEMLTTDVNGIVETIKLKGPENVLCVISTTSCFAPRGVDDIETIAYTCKLRNIFHLVNNAYGLQSSYCIHQIRQAIRYGNIDVFVQSTDKNLMVPVGGCIVAGFSKDFITKIKETYPGRASSSPIIDVLATLLEMGVNGYKKLQDERKENFSYLTNKMTELAKKLDEHVLIVPENKISVAMSLQNLEDSSKWGDNLSMLGSMLYKRNVFGARVVTRFDTKEIEGVEFRGWGSHCSKYPYPYLTAAATLGMKAKDVDTFILKLEEVYKHLITLPRKDKSSKDSKNLISIIP